MWVNTDPGLIQNRMPRKAGSTGRSSPERNRMGYLYFRATCVEFSERLRKRKFTGMMCFGSGSQLLLTKPQQIHRMRRIITVPHQNQNPCRAVCRSQSKFLCRTSISTGLVGSDNQSPENPLAGGLGSGFCVCSMRISRCRPGRDMRKLAHTQQPKTFLCRGCAKWLWLQSVGDRI